MSIKKAIKAAITANSPKFRATKVWKIDTNDEDLAGNITMWIEVTVKRKPTPRKKK